MTVMPPAVVPSLPRPPIRLLTPFPVLYNGGPDGTKGVLVALEIGWKRHFDKENPAIFKDH